MLVSGASELLFEDIKKLNAQQRPDVPTCLIYAAVSLLLPVSTKQPHISASLAPPPPSNVASSSSSSPSSSAAVVTVLHELLRGLGQPHELEFWSLARQFHRVSQTEGSPASLRKSAP